MLRFSPRDESTFAEEELRAAVEDLARIAVPEKNFRVII